VRPDLAASDPGTFAIRYRLKDSTVDVAGTLTPDDDLIYSGIVPPLADEPDYLSVVDTQRLIRAWSKKEKGPIAEMFGWESASESDQDSVTFSGRAYPVDTLWYVEAADSTDSWVFYHDTGHDTFVPLQKNPDVGIAQ
jgi:hypothetical protein